MHSPIDVVDGTFSSAILTTFTIELEFVEHWVLPRLAAAGVRNVVVFSDAGQVAEKLSLGGSRRAGQQYHLVPVEARGVFHPKVIYLSGPDQQRACVSSANLTAAGQLRNIETAAVLSSEAPAHGGALQQIRSFLRALAVDQPNHVVEAVLEGIEHETAIASSAVNDGPRFVHNLSESILSQLPGPVASVTAPFVSAAALRSLASSSPRLEVTLDQRRIDAVNQARDVDVDLRVVQFVDEGGQLTDRVVHGKAIWADDRWCLVGSPNLTWPALLGTAVDGNIEAAVIIDETSFRLPPHQEGFLAQRSDVGHNRLLTSSPDRARVFQAVLDGDLTVHGLDDGIEVESETAIYWEPLGIVESGVVNVVGSRPLARLRARLPDGRTAYAMVHHVNHLRARRRRPPSRGALVVGSPPIDLQGVRELEAVLGNLYALDDLAGDEMNRLRSAGEARGASDAESTSIESWKPARPGEDPRVPDLYRTTFEGDPDALLMLVRNALRLERGDDDEVAAEDNEEWAEETADSETTRPDRRPPLTDSAVVRRYRGSLVSLLDRGATKVRSYKSEALRDLTFLEVLHFHEKLTESTVRIPVADASALGVWAKPDEEGNVEIPILQHEQLAETRWRLINAYVSSGAELTGTCASVLFTHLAAAVEDRTRLGPVVARQLDDLTYRVAASLLRTADPFAVHLSWLRPQRCISLLEDYAERTDWFAIVDHCEAEGWIESGDLEIDPIPTVSGVAAFSIWFQSPAWKLIGHSCVAGFEDTEPFAAVVRNADHTAPFSTHCLLVEPSGRSIRGARIHQALLRRVDGNWLCRTFDGFDSRSADRLLNVVGVHGVTNGLRASVETISAVAPSWLLGIGSSLVET